MNIDRLYITTELIDKNPLGINYAYDKSRTCGCVLIPRDHLQKVKKQKDLKSLLNRPALYVLLGSDDSSEENQNIPYKSVYIGGTENFLRQISSHNKSGFWNEVIVFIAKDRELLTETHALYLKSRAVDEAKKAGSYDLSRNNTTGITKPAMSNQQIKEAEDFFKEVKFFILFFRYFLFKPDLHKPIQKERKHNNFDSRHPAPLSAGRIYYCKNSRGTEATGVYRDNKLRVLAGSKLCKEMASSFTLLERRERLLLENAEEGKDTYLLIRDIVFDTPSAAASFCLGTESNGWDVWINEERKTIHEIERGDSNRKTRNRRKN